MDAKFNVDHDFAVKLDLHSLMTLTSYGRLKLRRQNGQKVIKHNNHLSRCLTSRI